MPKPTNLEVLETVAGASLEFEDSSEFKPGKKKTITARVSHGAGNRRSGVLVRHFARVDGVPVATVLVNSDEPPPGGGGTQATREASLRPVRGFSQSVRVLAWDRTNPPAAFGEIQSRRVRFTVK